MTIAKLRALLAAATPGQGIPRINMSVEDARALLDCVEAAKAMRQGKDCPMCDNGKLRNPAKEHWDDCGFAVFDAALARLEEGE